MKAKKIRVDNKKKTELYLKLLRENKAIVIKKYICDKHFITHTIRCYSKFIEYDKQKIRLTPEMFWRIMTVAKETKNYLLIDYK